MSEVTTEDPAAGQDIIARLTLAEVLEWCEAVREKFNLYSFSANSSSDTSSDAWACARYKGEFLHRFELLSDLETLVGEIDGRAEEIRAAKIEKLKAELAELEGGA